MVTEDDVLLFGAAFDDIEDPIQTTFLALSEHVRADELRIDFGRFGHHTDTLSGVLLDVDSGTRID